MKKNASQLAKEYGFNNDSEYFDYIIESMQNGQREQVKKLFSNMCKSDQQYFLTTRLNVFNGIEKSTLNVCICELLK